MRKIPVIVAMLLVFLCNTGLSQVCKLPLLIEHFKEHRTLNHTVTLLDFLYMHYGGNDNNEDDNAKDQSLPFKQFDHCLQLLVFNPASRVTAVKITIPSICYPHPPLRDQLSDDPFNGSSFKPPQPATGC